MFDSCPGLHCPGCKEGSILGAAGLLVICIIGAKLGEDMAQILWECLLDVFLTTLAVVFAMGLYARRTLRRMEPEVVCTQSEVNARQKQLGTHVSQRRAIGPTVVNRYYQSLHLHGVTSDEAAQAAEVFRRQLPGELRKPVQGRVWPREDQP